MIWKRVEQFHLFNALYIIRLKFTLMKKSTTARKKKNYGIKVNRHLYQYSGIYFVVFFLLALIAFWTSYYGRLSAPMDFEVHFHGITMTLWCLMLISQAFLIRFKKHSWHRFSGKLSYLLVPLIVISGFNIAHFTIDNVPEGHPARYYRAALMFNSIVVFAIIYGLAIYFRKKPKLHARYMICTILPLITPITDRIIFKYIPALVSYAPAADGIRMVPALGFALGQIVLIALIIWDWKKNRQFNAFFIAWIPLTIYHISVLYFYEYSFWQTFTEWLMSLPLS